jgi:xanthine dehydrogenase accessory factor
MLDILESIVKWYEDGQSFGLATVVNTFRSAPRQPGAAMAVSASGEVVGSVSGGCVEGAVYDLAAQVIESGVPVLQRYGVSDEDAFSVGLTCGGILDIYVEPVDARRYPELPDIAAAVAAGRPAAVATLVAGPEPIGARFVTLPDRQSGSLGNRGLDFAVADDARGMLATGSTRLLRYGTNGQRRMDAVAVFVQVFSPPPHMIVFGAIDFAAAVARIGKFLGYRVTVCDARGVFATSKRFPHADEIVVSWPHRYLESINVDERTALCVLTHDPKFDVPLLEVALTTPAGYIGAMGSRRTHDERIRQLRDRGVPAELIARLRSPIGLDIGARTPEETAVSIAAELIASRWGASGMPLTGTGGRIHGELTGNAPTAPGAPTGAADAETVP